MEMTIFFLHPCARRSAEYLHDKMLPIMALESQNLMATAIQMRFLESDVRLPIPTSQSHPWLDWAMSSIDHMEWLFSYYITLTEQLDKISTRKDRSWKFQIATREWISLFPRNNWQDPPIVVPADCFDNSPITAYRTYYLRAKCRLGSYKRVRIPYWARDHYDRSALDEAENPGTI